MKALHIILGSILAFVSLNAMLAGVLFLIDPSGVKMGLSLETISNTPFSNYYIPGIILLVIIGFGCLVATTIAFKKNKYTGLLGILIGLILCGWIHIQMIWLAYSWMQTVIFGFGCLSIFLGTLIIYYVNKLRLK
jgi:hypothetical protein